MKKIDTLTEEFEDLRMKLKMLVVGEVIGELDYRVLKEKFLALTNNKKLISEEKKEELLKKYQAKLGISREELLKIFEGI